ncbi:hypothetical protein [Streptomyces sp. NPDC093094]|uniref:hypothetical protein n=1 Tax=Streptomyces sp. NPDC093094 TaxID=3366026 RepID=UPI0037F4D88B
MSVAEAAGPAAARKDDPLDYELRMASHALASALEGTPAEPARVEQLLRTVIDLGNRALRSGGRLPARPFAFVGGHPPIGAGALLAEYADPGSTSLTGLVSELNGRLLDELDQLVTHDEAAAPKASVPAQRTGSGPDEVPLLLDPVDDWYTVARAAVAFRGRTAAGGPATDRAVRATWTALPAPVAAEVERGLKTACRLVSGIGRFQPPEVGALIDVRNALSPTVVAARACAAAVALTYLAHEGGLPTPGGLGVLVLAGCADDGTWTPYAQGGRALPDTGEDGLDRLWRDDEGWRLRTGTETRSDPDPGLEGAARLLWGERWQETRRRWARETLDTFEWRILHSTAGAGQEGPGSWMHEGGDGLVELPQAGVLAHRFLHLPTSRVIQSGTRNSGKSVCARQLVGKLEKAGWQTVAIAPRRRHLPTDGSLPTIVRAALIAARAEGTTRNRLVVLEDLHALVDGNIGAALESLGELGVAVLAVTRYVDGATSVWDTHSVMPYMTPVMPEELSRLGARLVADHPDVYRTTDEAGIALAVEGSAGDLAVLAGLLRDGVTPAPAGDGGRREAARLVSGQAERACAGLDDAGRTAVGRLAAVSLLDEGVPVAQLGPVREDTRAALGVVVHEDLARIPSGVRAEAVLEALGIRSPEDRRTCLEEYLLAMLAEDDHERVRALMTNCAAYQPELLSVLLESRPLRQAVTSWAARSHPPTALRLLRLCAGQSDPTWIAAALPPVLVRLPDTPELRVHDLTTALRTLWDHQYQLPAAAVADLVAWIGSPDGGLDTVLERPSTIRERRRFVHALLRLSGDSTTPVTEVCAWLESRSDALVRGADPGRADDLIAIRRMDDVIHRWSREARGADAGRDGLRPLERSTSPLLEQHPTRQTPLSAVLAWISLMVHFDGTARWDPLIKQYEQQIRAALHHADAIQICTALSDLARNNRGLTNRLLNNLQLGRTLAAVLKSSTPAEAAILIRTVRNIHGITIKSLLYREPRGGSPVADVQLARDLAATVRRLKDGRGAGMLLSSVSRADDLYCDTRDGFGPVLAAELGADFARELMALERRPAVIYHFLKGLWEAGAEYRTDLEEQALNLVVASIQAQRSAARPWGPQLAMLLIEDDYFGQQFLMRLADRLDTRLLVDRMRNPSLDPQSMVHTHRLGLALNPRIGEEFSKKADVDRAVRSPVQWSAGDVAQKLQVMSGTLRAGGDIDASTRIVQNFKDEYPQWDWAQNLRALRGIGSFTTALNQLRKLDPSEAATAVSTLSTPQDDQTESHVTDMVLRSVIHPPLTNDLLSAVERCRRGLGKSELAALRDGREDRWQVFTEIFKFEQDPITQGVVGRGLARLGVVPARETKNWMRTLVVDRWASTLHLLASPRGITEVLMLAYTWEPQWGEQLAETVESGRLCRRLRRRMRPDLRELPNLVTALLLTGRRDLIEEIVRDLGAVPAEWVAESMGLQQAPRMLKALRHAEQPTDLLLPGVGLLLERALARPRVVDAEEHWSQIGWAAQALADCGGRQYVPDAWPALEPNTVAYPAAVAWAMTWLASGDRADATAGAALDVFERSGYAQWQQRKACMALIAAARAGRVPAGDPLAEHWQMATEGGAELLTLLSREADRVPSIAAHFRKADVSRRMRALIDAPGVSTLPCHPELAAAVARLCPRTATPGATAGDLGL